MKNLGNRIRILRKQLSKSQEEFALDLGVTKQAISNIENSKSSPSPQVLYKLHTKLHVNLNYIIAGSGDVFVGSEKKEDLKKALMKEFEQILKARGIE